MGAGRSGRSRIVGSAVLRLDSVPSTNSLASQLAVSGCPDGTVVIAKSQIAGRGRRGRTWHSPREGGLWFSVVLRPLIPPSHAQILTFLGAVAVAKALRGIGVKSDLKWPNDIMWKGMKMGGVLTESVVIGGKMKYAILGIGLNVSMGREDFPAGLSDSSVSVSMAAGKAVNQAGLLRGILGRMDRLYAQIVRPAGREAILRDWRLLCDKTMRNVVLREGVRQWEGKVEDFGEEGSLILCMADGTKRVFHSGEVTVVKKTR